MKNTTTLKAVLAALTLAGISSPLVAAAQPEGNLFGLLVKKIDFSNARNGGGTTWVSISAKQSDGTVVQKGVMPPPKVIHYGKTAYSDASFIFKATDTIIVNGGDYQDKNGKIVKLPSCEIKVSDMKPNTRITIYDHRCAYSTNH